MKVRRPARFWVLTAILSLIVIFAIVNLILHPIKANAKGLVPPLSQVNTVEVWHSGKTVKLQSQDIEQIYRLLDRDVKRNLLPDNGFLWHSAGSPLEMVYFTVGSQTYYLGIESNVISWNNYRYYAASSNDGFKQLDDFILDKFK